MKRDRDNLTIEDISIKRAIHEFYIENYQDSNQQS